MMENAWKMPGKWVEMDLSGDFMKFLWWSKVRLGDCLGQEKDGENDGDLGEHLGGNMRGFSQEIQARHWEKPLGDD